MKASADVNVELQDVTGRHVPVVNFAANEHWLEKRLRNNRNRDEVVIWNLLNLAPCLSFEP